MAALIASGLGFLCLGAAGWIGGKLVHAHRLGGSPRD